jgi:hypothetical protein
LDFQNNPPSERLRRTLVMLIALAASGAAGADIPELDQTTFDRNLFRGNFFNWVDFDPEDISVSWPEVSVSGSGLTTYVAERVAHDDNIYRLPRSGTPGPSAPGASREDDIDTVTAGVDGRWGLYRESLELLLRADYNRFSHNGNLDNTSGSAQGFQHWEIGPRLFGAVGASYDRFLADFANYRAFTQDVVQSHALFAAAHLELGSLWQLNAGGRHGGTVHSADAVEDTHNDTVTVGAECHAPDGAFMQWNYQYTNGRFPHSLLVGGVPFNRDFREHTSAFRIESPLFSAFRVRGDIGYVHHAYPGAPDEDFSGGIWDLSLAWEPRSKARLLVSASRQLHAYVDAESEYYVAEGVRAVGTWAPTAKLTVEAEVSREKQSFVGPSTAVTALAAPKHNLVHSRRLNLAWSINRPLQVVVAYRFLTRDSNPASLGFDDNLVSASLQARF